MCLESVSVHLHHLFWKHAKITLSASRGSDYEAAAAGTMR